MEFQRHWLKKRILLPLTVLAVAVIGASLYLAHGFMRGQLNEEFDRSLQGVEEYWQVDLKHHGIKLGAMLTTLARDERLQAAFAAGDRAALLERAGPLFEQMRTAYGIDYLTFIDPQRRVVLRTSNPDMHGDIVGIPLLESAEDSDGIITALEFGEAGGLGLRAVLPWRADGQLLGYVVVGESVHHMLHHVDELFHMQQLLVIDKGYFEQRGLNRVKDVEGALVDWDRYPRFLLLHQSLEAIPPRLEAML